MIDARRMEVFTAVYDENLTPVIQPSAVLLNENSFKKELQKYLIYFIGSGIKKFQPLIKNDNAVFLNIQHDTSHMQTIAEELYLLKSFADKAYSEPYYLKEVFTTQQKIKTNIKTS
jgi:tRNA threonylcarbamoyladenosine biosynthesis protein TsaB